MDYVDDTTKVFYEQYRDVANRFLSGYVLRWKVSNVVEVDVFEIQSAGINDVDGWPAGLGFDDAGDEMQAFAQKPDQSTCELDHLAPQIHLYMKYEGTVHLWVDNYLTGGGDAAHVLYIADLLRYVSTRAAQYIQQRLETHHSTNKQPVFPLNYNPPVIEVKPYTPRAR